MKRGVVILAVLSAALAVLVVFLLATRPPAPPGPASASGRKVLYYRNPMNPGMTSPTPRKAPDGMDYVPVYADEAGGAGATDGGVRIDPATVQNTGVKIGHVTRRDLSKVIRTVGRVDYDETRVYNVTTKIVGYIEKLYVNFTGQLVHKGEPLLEIYSPEVVSAQQEYLVALRNLATVSTRSFPDEIESARKLVEDARRRLKWWDIPEHEIKELEERGEARRTVMLHAPVDGIVVDKLVLEGAASQPGMNLFKIADLSVVWVYAEVFEYELPWVAVGQRAEIELPYLPGRVFRGRVVYIDPSLSSQTRTARVRIELPNRSREFVLRPNMFATVRLLAPPLAGVLVIPDQAVIRSGDRTLLVLALEGGRFTSREVTLGVSADSLVQVVAGVDEGDRIVTSGQFLIDSESNLRAALSTVAPPASGPAAAPPAAAMPGMDMPGRSDSVSTAGHRH